MSLASKLKLSVLSVLFSPRGMDARRWISDQRRRLSREGHVVSVFLQLDDPYSYLLAHYLPELAAQYDIELRLHFSEALGGDFQPAAEMLAEYAMQDCARLAAELGIPFLDKGQLPPTEYRAGLANAVAAFADSAEFQQQLFEALAVYWRGDAAAAAQMSAMAAEADRAAPIIAASQATLRRLGHYSSAMLHYAGEWYWGVDRLHYLSSRLDKLGVRNSHSADGRLSALLQATQVSLPVQPPAAAKQLPPIEYFHSFRSPYSYLGLRRVGEIADAFGVELKFRPVLPMVMRGMPMPKSKLLYIVGDAAREARRKGIPFGKVADPLGAGAERCLAVFPYAESEHRAREFLVHAGAAIWAEAIDVATDSGLRKVTGRTGLFWPEVKAALADDDWRSAIEPNREAMMRSGSWGVPTIRMGDFVSWGQDRDWMLVRHIEELCDAGDGILV